MKQKGLLPVMCSFLLTPGVVAAVMSPILLGQPGYADSATPRCHVVSIHEVGYLGLDDIKTAAGVHWWIELGDELLLCGADMSLGPEVRILASYGDLVPRDLRISHGFHSSDLARMELEVLASGGGVAVVWATDFSRFESAAPDDTEQGRGVLSPALPNTVLVRQAANKPPRLRTEFGPAVQGLVDLVDGDRWFADVETLASYNRYTHRPEIHQARDWLVGELQALPGLVVTTPSFNAHGTIAYNVVATLTGSSRPDEWYIIGGHYDSTSDDTQTAAPGAEDNASGCAGVLEMARIFTANPPEATTIFICYSAEELGLIGSEDHVADLMDAGDLSKVQTMLNLDMIGYTIDSELDCKLETDLFAISLFDIFEDAATQFTTLTIVTSQFACCSDHKPYLLEDVPALMTIEADYRQYPYYHTVNDLPEHLTIDMARQILRMNVAAMAQMIGASEPALFRDGFETGTTSPWSRTFP